MTFGAEIRCTTNHSIGGYSKGVILLSRDVFFYGTVLPAKSDSDVKFCLQVIRDLQSIDHLCNNPILRI